MLMAVQSLDHFTINAVDLERSIRFYEEVVGLRNGDRPAFTFPGAWLYCGEKPVVHLVGGDHSEHGTGSVDHVAFRAAELERYVKNLEKRQIPFTERDVPGMPLHQVFLKDPDGVTLELNFWDEA
jgi:catechol 2,3-dioxygenase-like lactoylglutathione lyase family enzyme